MNAIRWRTLGVLVCVLVPTSQTACGTLLGYAAGKALCKSKECRNKAMEAGVTADMSIAAGVAEEMLREKEAPPGPVYLERFYCTGPDAREVFSLNARSVFEACTRCRKAFADWVDPGQVSAPCACRHIREPYSAAWCPSEDDFQSGVPRNALACRER